MLFGRGSERGSGVPEVVVWAAAASVVLAVASFVVIVKPGQAKTQKLTAEQQAYVLAVATQRANANISALATQQAAAFAQVPPPATRPATPFQANTAVVPPPPPPPVSQPPPRPAGAAAPVRTPSSPPPLPPVTSPSPRLLIATPASPPVAPTPPPVEQSPNPTPASPPVR